MIRDPVNCPSCGRFLKWHSSGDDPDEEDYKEWYTCICDGIECFPGESSVLIRSKEDLAREQRRYRSLSRKAIGNE